MEACGYRLTEVVRQIIFRVIQKSKVYAKKDYNSVNRERPKTFTTREVLKSKEHMKQIFFSVGNLKSYTRSHDIQTQRL